MPAGYRGVDRCASFPSPVFWPELIKAGRRRLVDAIYEYEPSAKMSPDRRRVHDLRSKLKEEGLVFDVIFVEIEAIPDTTLSFPSAAHKWQMMRSVLPAWLPAHRRLRDMRTREEDLLGYDVSLPFHGFHSALVNPGLDINYPTYRAELNENGLFRTMAIATTWMNRANELDYGPFPFCVLGVYESAD